MGIKYDKDYQLDHNDFGEVCYRLYSNPQGELFLDINFPDEEYAHIATLTLEGELLQIYPKIQPYGGLRIDRNDSTWYPPRKACLNCYAEKLLVK